MVYKRYTDRSKLIDCHQLEFSGESRIVLPVRDTAFKENL